MVDYKLILPLVYLRSILQDLSTSGNGEGGSEHVPLGHQFSRDRQHMMLSGFCLC